MENGRRKSKDWSIKNLLTHWDLRIKPKKINDILDLLALESMLKKSVKIINALVEKTS